jgi:hypothetical protein
LRIKPVEVQRGLIFHSAGIESGNLIIGAVGGDVSAGREFVGDDFDVFRGYSVFRKPFKISLIIMADRGADERLFTH